MVDDRRQLYQGALTRLERVGAIRHEPHKRGLNSKLHLAVDAHGMPVRLELTEGTTADCTQAQSLTADLPAQYLLADRGYDTNAIVAEAICM